MTDSGRIREIREKLIIVTPERGEACFGCMNLECRNGGFISAENPQGLPLQPGQLVEVKAPAASLFSQAASAILPPAAAFAAAFALVRIFFPAAGEGAAAGMGIILLFASAFAILKIRKNRPAQKAFTVTRILD